MHPRDPNTTAGGPGGAFPSTLWSLVADAKGGSPEQRQACLERLIKLYWKPVYQYIRMRWPTPNEDAKDLTQAFFLHVLESGFVSAADPARGRFRVLVKRSLDHFLMNERRNRTCLKRGGGRIRSLDALLEDSADLPLPTAEEADGGDVLDRLWKDELISRAVTRLRQAFAEEGKERYFRLFEDYYLSPGEAVDYEALTARHGLKKTDVTNYLFAARRRFQAILMELIADSVDGEAALQEEYRDLFGGRDP